MQQLTLFECDIKTLEEAVEALLEAGRSVASLEAEIKSTAQVLRDCETAETLRELREDLKSAKLRRANASADLAKLQKR